MSNTEMVTITKEEYDELLNEVSFLNCLRNAGVDNWDGYEYAQEAYQELRELQED